MLQVTLDKNDYFMIDDQIRVQYVRNKGECTFTIAVSAPRDMEIKRKTLPHNMTARLETGANIYTLPHTGV